MHIYRGRNHLSRMYKLNDDVLNVVTQAKYLGVTVTDNLSWSTHTSSVAARANSEIGFLWRNLRHCPKELREQAYISLVRSIMEYSASVWDPHLKKDKLELERAQRRAARFVTGDSQWSSSVTAMM